MSVNKIYESIKKNQKNVSFEDIDKLMKAGGFKHRRGNHHIYTHPDLHGIEDSANIPFNRPILPVYIKKALEKFDLANPDFGKE